MKTRIYIAILTLILLAGIIIIYRSPPPDVVVQEVAATITIPAVAVVKTVASTGEATTTIVTTATATIPPSVSVIATMTTTMVNNTVTPNPTIVITPTRLPTNTPIPIPSNTPVSPTTVLPISTPIPTTSIPIATPTFEPISGKPIGGYVFGKPKLILTHNYVEIVGWLPDSNEELIIRNFENDKFLVEILNVKTSQRKRVVETSRNIIGNPVWLSNTQQMAYLSQDESGTINLYLNSLGVQDVSLSAISSVSPPLVPDKTGAGILVFDTQMQQLLNTNRNSRAIQELSIAEPLPIVEGGPFPHYQAAWSNKTEWTAYYHPVRFLLANSQTGETENINLGKAPGGWGQWGAAYATWSPNGQNLAIIVTPSDSARFGPVPFTQLIIYNVNTGEIHHLENDFAYITNVVWAPDNKNVLIKAVTGQQNGYDIELLFLINIIKNQIISIPIIPNEALGLSFFSSLAWSPNGEQIIIGYAEQPGMGEWYYVTIQIP